MSDWDKYKYVIDFMKASMKPGFLYGVSEDGELYAVEVEMPKPGETIILPLRMPKKEQEGE